MFKLAENFTLPASAIADTIAFVGTRGTGKSYAAGKMVETFVDGGAQVVVIDPVGIWWGLRLAADGKRTGLDIPVFGGIHGDLPLEPGAGELVARLAAERRMSAVFDVSDFTMGQQRRFVVDFARQLFELKKRNRSPVHVVLEEAHEFLPQQVDAGAAEMVGVVKRLWKIGRNFGIGGTLISQRIAELNKGALNLSTYMIAGKLKGPQDRKAIEGWARDQDVDESVLAELPTLPKGNLFAWGDAGVVRLRVNQKRTFDSSKTPEAGDPIPPELLPKIDLAEVRAAMAKLEATEEEEEPPKRGGKPAIAVAPPLPPEVREVPVFPARMLESLQDASTNARQARGELSRLIDRLDTMVVDGRHLTKAHGSSNGTPVRIPAPVTSSFSPSAEASKQEHGADDAGDGSMRMLRAMAGRHPTPLTEQQVATLAVMKRKGGSFRTYRSRLVVAGHIRKDGNLLYITDAGLRAAGPVQRPASGAQMLAMWREKFSGKAVSLLELFAGGGVYAKREAFEKVGLDPGGGSARTYWSRLASCGLLERTQGGFRAVESLRAS